MISSVWLHSRELSLLNMFVSFPHPYKDDKACFLSASIGRIAIIRKEKSLILYLCYLQQCKN